VNQPLAGRQAAALLGMVQILAEGLCFLKNKP